MVEPTNTGDYTTVANVATVTEAQLLQGTLRAGGLDAQVPDANVSQVHSLMTVALGGVRVVVPAGQVESAREILKALEQGALKLDDDDEASTPPAARPVLSTPVFSPDRALLLSVILTPAFAVAIQIANARILQRRQGQVAQWLAFVVLACISAAVVLVAHGLNPGTFLVFRASPVMLVFGLSWYFFLGGHAQSRALIDTYGPRYPRRSLLAPGLIGGAICLFTGWALDQFVL